MKNKIKKKLYLNISENRILHNTKNYILKKNNLKLNHKTKFLKKKKSKFKNKYISIPILLLFTISFCVIISRLIYSKNGKYINLFKQKPSKADIYFEEKFPNITESFNNAKDFLKICLDNKFINSEIIKPSINPKVSAVIPLYNCERVISRGIKSIQNQNISDIEIILVNDLSTDKTLSIIEQMQKEDSRIKIINNQKNMGTLYSRNIGALSAKGKYIFPLDDDDMLLDKDIYSTITKIADKGNFDIIGFRGVMTFVNSNNVPNHVQETYFSGHRNNHVLFQPELGRYPLVPGDKYGQVRIRDVFLWNKCIRTKIYQKALNKAGEERYSRFMINHEDVVATCFLFNTAESMKYVGKYGIMHIYNPGGASGRRKSNIDNYSNIYLIDMAIEFNKETFENRRVLVYLLTLLLDMPNLKEILDGNNYIKKLFISSINKILNMKYISNEDKKEIKDRTSKLEFLKP